MRNKYYDEMQTTDSPRVYARARKGYLAYSVGKIHCGFCKYHRRENATYHQDKSWKRTTKRRKQYKIL